MSIALELSSVSAELKAEITKTCMIKPSASQYNEDPKPVACFATSVSEDVIWVPMGAWKNFLDTFPDYDYPTTNVTFKKKLYTVDTDPKGVRDQNIVAAEAVTKLEDNHSVFMACFPGYGKCLEPNTEILMFDGTKKYAKDIKQSDLLMGDDSSPRKVLSICSPNRCHP